MGLLKNVARGVADAFLSSGVAIDFLNGFTCRYATVKKISLVDDGLAVIVQPNGSNELVEVTAKSITFADDNSSVAINELSANMPWVENSLQDFVQGKEYAIPEAGRSIVKQIRSILL